MAGVHSATILTIGHSSHVLAAFLSLLTMHGVTAVADIRSSPYSRFAPDFNREAFRSALLRGAIKYVFLGDELGGRSRIAQDYEAGRVSYKRMAEGHSFKRGLDRVISGSAQHRIALVCAERDPLDCHRTLLVARQLEKHGVAVAHIQPDGFLETNDAAMSRLLALQGMQEDGLFEHREQLIDRACELQERRVAYVDRREAQAAVQPG